MKKLIYSLTLFISSLSFAQSDSEQLEKIREDYIQEFSPQDYGFYQSGKSIAERGKQLTLQIAEGAAAYTRFINTDDPAAIVREYKTNLQMLEQLDASVDQEKARLIQSQLEDLRDQINANDAKGGIFNLFGTMSALAEMGYSKEQIARQKQELEKQKVAALREATYRRKKEVQPLMEEMERRTAFAETEEMEIYYKAYQDHLLQYINGVETLLPVKPKVVATTNNLIPEDQQWINKAMGKFRKFLISDPYFSQTALLEACIAYTAKAAKINPTAKNYMLLAEFYTFKNNLFAYMMYSTAKEIDPDYIENYSLQLSQLINSFPKYSLGLQFTYNLEDVINITDEEIEIIPEEVIVQRVKNFIRVDIQKYYPIRIEERLTKPELYAAEDIKNALKNDNIEALQSFLDLGLNKAITIDGKDVLFHAVKENAAECSILILNKYVEDLNQVEKNALIQKTIMLAVVHDSPMVIQKLKKMGVTTNFEFKGKSPVSLATELKAEWALAALNGAFSASDYGKELEEIARQKELERIRRGRTDNQINNDALIYIQEYFTKNNHRLPSPELIKQEQGLMDISTLRTEEGGTILHLFIETLFLNSSCEEVLRCCSSDLVNDLRIYINKVKKYDPDILDVKNLHGKTAFALVAENQKIIERALKNCELPNYKRKQCMEWWLDTFKTN